MTTQRSEAWAPAAKMNVGQAAHLSGQMSGQAAQMNQIGGNGVGVGGADGLPQQHQQMQDVVGVSGIDAEFVMLRNNMREKIFEYIGRKQSSADWRRRLPELARWLEEILFRKFSNKNEYYNMMKGPVEPQLQFAIKTLMAQNQMTRQMPSSSGYGTMIPTPGMTQGTSGNIRIPYVADNNALSSSGAGMVPQNANMGASMPELPPAVTVGGEDDALGDGQPGHPADGAGREVDVARPHHLAGGVRGGGDDDGEPAEAEQHEMAMALRKVAHGAVRKRAREVVQVADQRECPR